MPPARPSLARWRRLLGLLGGRPRAAAASYRLILRGYSEAGRAYHNLGHLGACLGWLDALPNPPPPEAEAALWFHDVVYRAGAADNEYLSAQCAWRSLLRARVDRHRCREIARMIVATRHHLPYDSASAVVVDVDLAVLGSRDYWAYERAIRREYAHIPEDIYRSGRAGLLSTLLQRPRIYHTPYLRLRLEPRARRNLRAALTALEA